MESLVQELLERASTELEQPIFVASTVGLQLNEPTTLPLLHDSNIGHLPSPSSYFGTPADYTIFFSFLLEEVIVISLGLSIHLLSTDCWRYAIP